MNKWINYIKHSSSPQPGCNTAPFPNLWKMPGLWPHSHWLLLVCSGEVGPSQDPLSPGIKAPRGFNPVADVPSCTAVWFDYKPWAGWFAWQLGGVSTAAALPRGQRCKIEVTHSPWCYSHPSLVSDSTEGGRGVGWDKGASAFKVCSALSENYHPSFCQSLALPLRSCIDSTDETKERILVKLPVYWFLW